MGVSVKDSGAGIPEKELDAVVKKYVQSSGTKSNLTEPGWVYRFRRGLYPIMEAESGSRTM